MKRIGCFGCKASSVVSRFFSRASLLFALLLTIMAAPNGFALTVAVVDPVDALSDSDEAKTMLAKIRKEAEPDTQRVKKLKDELNAILEKSKRDADIMTSDQRSRLEKELEDKQIDYQYVRQKLQKRQKEGRDRILEALGPKFEEAINQLIKEGKYDIILHKQAVFHSSDTFDITEDITDRINKMK